MALLDSERIIIRNGSGMFAPGDFPWRYSFCGYTLTPANPTTMVIEDAHKDARCGSSIKHCLQNGLMSLGCLHVYLQGA